MKKLMMILTFSFALLSQSCVFGDLEMGVSGDGNVVTEELNIEDFTGIHVSAGINVHLWQGDFHVEMVADENLHEYITVEKNGKMLKIGSERSIRNAKSKVVNVTLPELTDIVISSAGDVYAETMFTCEDLNISIGSAGDLDFNVIAESIDVSISSSGDCDLQGTTNALDADLSSAGDLNAFDLIADYVDITVSSAGDANVNASKEISMVASSAGNIYYKGDAKVLKESTSSAGSIRKQ